MLGKLDRIMRIDGGLSVLATAIGLIAFVVMASTFVLALLSASTFLARQSGQAGYASLEEVRGSMELQGSVVVTTATGRTAEVDAIAFTVSIVPGSSAIDLTPPTGENDSSAVIIDYRDDRQVRSDLLWSVDWVTGSGDGADDWLEEGELARITISGLSRGGVNELSPLLSPNTLFALEVRPPQGAVLTVERRMPDAIDTSMELK